MANWSEPTRGPILHMDKLQPVTIYSLDGLVVKVSAARVEDPGFESRLRWDFSGSSHTSDFKIGTPVATLPCAWHYSVSTRTGQPGVSILWLGEAESWICNFYLSVAAHKIEGSWPEWYISTIYHAWDTPFWLWTLEIVCADPSLRYTSLLLGR